MSFFSTSDVQSSLHSSGDNAVPVITTNQSSNAIGAWETHSQGDELPNDLPSMPQEINKTVQDAAALSMLQYGRRPFSRLVSVTPRSLSRLNTNRSGSRLGTRGSGNTSPLRYPLTPKMSRPLTREKPTLSRPVTRATRPTTIQRSISPKSRRHTPGSRRISTNRSRTLTAMAEKLQKDTYTAQLRHVQSEYEKNNTSGNLVACLDCLEKELVLKRDRLGLESPEAIEVIRKAGNLCNRLGKKSQELGDIDNAEIYLMKAEILNRNFPLQLAGTLNMMAAVGRTRYMTTADEEELTNSVVILKEALLVTEKAKKIQQLNRKKKGEKSRSGKRKKNAKEDIRLDKCTANTHLQLCNVLALLREHVVAAAHGQQAVNLLEETLSKDEIQTNSRGKKKNRNDDKERNMKELQTVQLGDAYLALSRQHLAMKLHAAAISNLEKGISSVQLRLSDDHPVVRSLKLQLAKITLIVRKEQGGATTRHESQLHEERLQQAVRQKKLISAMGGQTELYKGLQESQPSKTIDTSALLQIGIESKKKDGKRNRKVARRQARKKQNKAYGGKTSKQNRRGLKKKARKRKTRKKLQNQGKGDESKGDFQENEEGRGFRRMTRADVLRAKTGYTVQTPFRSENENNDLKKMENFEEEELDIPEKYFQMPKNLTTGRSYRKQVAKAQMSIARRNAQVSKPSFAEGLRPLSGELGRTAEAGIVRMPEWLMKQFHREALFVPQSTFDNDDQVDHDDSTVSIHEERNLNMGRSKNAWMTQNIPQEGKTIEKYIKDRFDKRLRTQNVGKKTFAARLRKQREKERNAKAASNQIILLRHYKSMLQKGVPRRAIERDMRSRDLNPKLLDEPLVVTNDSILGDEGPHRYLLRQKIRQQREYVAASRLQAVRRGQIDRGRARTRRKERDLRNAAVTKIQAGIRGWTGRSRARTRRNEIKQIQQMEKRKARHWTARRRLELLSRHGLSSRGPGLIGARLAIHNNDRGERLSRRGRTSRYASNILFHFSEDELRELDSALSIQRAQRGIVGRKRANIMKLVKTASDEHINAAIGLQKVCRGYQGRRQFATKKLLLNCTEEMWESAVLIQTRIRVLNAQRKAYMRLVKRERLARKKRKYPNLFKKNELKQKRKDRKRIENNRGKNQQKRRKLQMRVENIDENTVENRNQVESEDEKVQDDKELQEFVPPTAPPRVADDWQNMKVKVWIKRSFDLKMPKLESESKMRGVYAVVKVLPHYMQHGNNSLELERAKLFHRTKTSFWQPDLYRTKMAISIQSLFRGYRIRSANEEIRILSIKREPNLGLQATKIQALFRGRRVQRAEKLALSGAGKLKMHRNVYNEAGLTVECGPGPVGLKVCHGPKVDGVSRGVIVTGFQRSSDNAMTALEASGNVKPGMLLVAIDGMNTVSLPSHQLKKTLEWISLRPRKTLTFRRMKKDVHVALTLELMANDKKVNAASIIQHYWRKFTIRATAAGVKIDNEDVRNGIIEKRDDRPSLSDFFLTIHDLEEQSFLYFKGRDSFQSTPDAILISVVIGERGQSWKQKIRAEKERFINGDDNDGYKIGPRCCETFVAEPTEYSHFNQGFWLQLKGLYYPEVHFRVIGVAVDTSRARLGNRNGRNGEKIFVTMENVLSEAKFYIPPLGNRRSGAFQTRSLRSVENTAYRRSDAGSIRFSWEKVNIQSLSKSNEINIGVDGFIVRRDAVLHVPPESTMGCVLCSGIAGIGAKVEEIEPDGAAEFAGICIGMYLISIDGEDISVVSYTNCLAMLRAKQNKHRILIFSTRMPEEGLLRGAADALQVSRKAAALTIQSAFQRRQRYKKFKAEEERGPIIMLTIVDVVELPTTRNKNGKVTIVAVLGEEGLPFSKKVVAAEQNCRWREKKNERLFEAEAIDKVQNPQWCTTCKFYLDEVESPEISLQIFDVIYGESGVEVDRSPVSECTISISDFEINSNGPQQYNAHAPGMREFNNCKICVSWEKLENNTNEFVTAIVPPGTLSATFIEGFGGIGCRIERFMLEGKRPGSLQSCGVKCGMYLRDVLEPRQKREDGRSLGDDNYLDVMTFLRTSASVRRVFLFSSEPSDFSLNWVSTQAFSASVDPKGVAVALIQRNLRNYLADLRIQDLVVIPHVNIATVYSQIEILKKRIETGRCVESDKKGDETRQWGSGSDDRLLMRARNVLSQLYKVLQLMIREQDLTLTRKAIDALKTDVKKKIKKLAAEESWVCRQLGIKKAMIVARPSDKTLLEIKAEIDVFTVSEIPEKLEPGLGSNLRLAILRANDLHDILTRRERQRKLLNIKRFVPSLCVQVLAGERGRRWASKLEDSVKSKLDDQNQNSWKRSIMTERAVEKESIISLDRVEEWSPWSSEAMHLTKHGDQIAGTAIWNETKMLSLSGIRHPELTVRLLECFGEGENLHSRVLGECDLTITNARGSGGAIEIDFRDSHAKGGLFVGGSILINWQRAMSVQLSSGLYKLPPLLMMSVDVYPGSLCAKFAPGIGGVGIRVSGFFLDGKNQPGQLEKQGIQLGMYLVEINGDSSVSSMPAADALLLLKEMRDFTKHMVWGTQPSKKAVESAVINAISGSAEKQAVARLQRCVRRWQEKQQKKKVRIQEKEVREARKETEVVEVEEIEEKKIGDVIEILVTASFGLPHPRFADVERRLSRALLCVGEAGMNWERKIKHSNSKFIRTGQTAGVPKNTAVIWNQSFVLDLIGLEKPEVNIRVIDADEEDHEILGEVSFQIIEETSDGLQVFEFHQGSIELVWRKVSETNAASLPSTSDHAEFSTCAIAVAISESDNVAVNFEKAPTGNGAVVSEFSERNSKIEATGVRKGMYLCSISGEKACEGENVENTQTIIRMARNRRPLSVMTFCNEMSDTIWKTEMLELFSKFRKSENATRMIQSMFRKWKYRALARKEREKRVRAKNRARDIEMSSKFGDNLFISILGAFGSACDVNESNAQLKVHGLLGERGHPWNTKLEKSKMSKAFSRDFITRKIAPAKKVKWGEQHFLNLSDIIEPEISLRLIMERFNNDGDDLKKIVIGEISISLMKQHSETSKHTFRDNVEGTLLFSWHREVSKEEDFTKVLDDTSIDVRIRAGTKISSCVRFKPFYCNRGLRVFSLLARGISLKKAGVKLGYYLTEVDGKCAVGILECTDAIALLESGVDKDRILTFSPRPSKLTLKFMALSAIGLTDPESAAAAMMQRAIRRRLAQSRVEEIRLAKIEGKGLLSHQIGSDVRIVIYQANNLPKLTNDEVARNHDRMLAVQVMVGPRMTSWASKKKIMQEARKKNKGKPFSLLASLCKGRDDVSGKVKRSVNDSTVHWPIIESDNCLVSLQDKSNVEISLRLVEMSRRGKFLRSLGEGSFVLKSLRSSNVKIRVALDSDAGTEVILKWFRSIEIPPESSVFDDEEEEEELNVCLKMPPGPLSCEIRISPALENVGARLAAFFPYNVKDKASFFESSRARIGMFVTKINNRDISCANYEEILSLLFTPNDLNSNSWALTFSSRPTNELNKLIAIHKHVVDADSEGIHISKIQTVWRRKVGKRNSFDTTIRMKVISTMGLLKATRGRKKSSKLTFLRSVVGESGDSFKVKSDMADSKKLLQRKWIGKKFQPKAATQIWNESFVFDVRNLKNPELTLELVEKQSRANQTIANAMISLPLKQQSSGGNIAFRLLPAPGMPKLSRRDEKQRMVTVQWERIESVKIKKVVKLAKRSEEEKSNRKKTEENSLKQNREKINKVFIKERKKLRNADESKKDQKLKNVETKARNVENKKVDKYLKNDRKMKNEDRELKKREVSDHRVVKKDNTKETKKQKKNEKKDLSVKKSARNLMKRRDPPAKYGISSRQGSKRRLLSNRKKKGSDQTASLIDRRVEEKEKSTTPPQIPLRVSMKEKKSPPKIPLEKMKVEALEERKRAMKKKRSRIRENIESKLNEFTIKVKAGPLSMCLCPGPQRIGAFISRFTKLASGEAGQVESQGIRVGMVLKRVDALDVSNMSFSDIMGGLKNSSKKSKTIVFAKPTKEQLLMISIEAMKGNEEKAAILVQKKVRRRKRKVALKGEDKMKLSNEANIETKSEAERSMEEKLEMARKKARQLREDQEADLKSIHEAKAEAEKWSKKALDEERIFDEGIRKQEDLSAKADENAVDKERTPREEEDQRKVEEELAKKKAEEEAQRKVEEELAKKKAEEE
eukprot:g3375.t1